MKKTETIQTSSIFTCENIIYNLFSLGFSYIVESLYCESKQVKMFSLFPRRNITIITVAKALTSGLEAQQRCFISLFINPYLTNGFSHHYQLDQTLSFLGVLGVIFIFISFFDEISLCKQNSTRWDTAFCGGTAFAYVPQKGRHA